ncbi:MAG: lipoyl synthase [Thermodesulfobacteriota bacterium]
MNLTTATRHKPPWLRVRLPHGPESQRVQELLRDGSLHSVCEEAHCPNRGECWGRGTATFLILGDVCTRSCRFCAVKNGRPCPPDAGEAERLAQTVGALGLRHVVITSVTRDDLPDGGASLFAATINELGQECPECSIEVLIPDFKGSTKALVQVVSAGPQIVAHNLETVPRLYAQVRPQARYQRSLRLLSRAKAARPAMLVKSGLMLGLGEKKQEIREVMLDLVQAGCDILTLGQYLAPTKQHLPVVRYWRPEEFAALKSEALDLGFAWVESGPLVRSSYRAGAVFKRPEEM